MKDQKNATCLTAVNRIGTDGKRYAGRAASELSESEDLKNEEGKLSDEDYEYTEGSFKKYGIPEDIQQKLKDKGITHLFPVQYETYKQTKEGWDVVVQARTGTGKTLSFAIPLVENLQKSFSNKRSRLPKVIILEPTRELANQVAQDIKDISSSLSIGLFYGGADYMRQMQAINIGLDIVVGTPGRTLDMIGKGALRLDDIEHVVIDEVDKMLDMGFADDVESIIADCYSKEQKPQTMLYSATMPSWVFQVAKKYLKDQYKHVNLIGQNEEKTSTTVEHLALTCHHAEIPTMLHDVIRVYCGQHGRVMIFCQTKLECDRLASETLFTLRPQVLHGDISQIKRDVTIQAFKKGTHKVLLTTDVAARGLDIPNVELVIQTSIPKNPSDYIHRSGRTGRAGKKGTSLVFFTPNELKEQRRVEKFAKVEFKRIGAPTQEQIINASAHDVGKSLDKVLPETLEHFREAALDLIDERGAENALAAAMAVITGATRIASRSILSSQEGKTAYILRTHRETRTTEQVYRWLPSFMGENLFLEVNNVTLLKDGHGAVFDIPSDLEDDLEKAWKDSPSNTLEKAKELPDIIDNPVGMRRDDRGFQNRGFGRGRDSGDYSSRSRQFDRGFGGRRGNRSWSNDDDHFAPKGNRGWPNDDDFAPRGNRGWSNDNDFAPRGNRQWSNDDDFAPRRRTPGRQTQRRSPFDSDSDDDF